MCWSMGGFLRLGLRHFDVPRGGLVIWVTGCGGCGVGLGMIAGMVGVRMYGWCGVVMLLGPRLRWRRVGRQCLGFGFVGDRVGVCIGSVSICMV